VALLVWEEDGRELAQNRLEALIAGHGWDRERVLGNIHLHALDGVRLDDAAWQIALSQEAAALGADLVVVDTAGTAMNGSELSKDDAKVVTGFCRALHKAGHAVLLILHVSKPSEQRPEKGHRLLGSVEWFNAPRMAWWVERRDTGPTLECIKASRTRRPDPLAIVRAVRTDPTNEASWLEATMTLGADTAAAGALSNLDLAVLGVLCKAINPPSSTDVRLLVRKAGGKGNNEEINASVAGLRAADLIQWKSVGKAKAWSPTDAGRAAYARARGEGGNAE
jgi:ribosomal protein L12E/L44/L45/RPP1/RPP2